MVVVCTSEVLGHNDGIMRLRLRKTSVGKLYSCVNRLFHGSVSGTLFLELPKTYLSILFEGNVRSSKCHSNFLEMIC